MKTKYANGRHLGGNAFDLEECPLHDDVRTAVAELMARVRLAPDAAPMLQLLQCKTQDGDVLNYEPVCSGVVVREMMK